jgi:hypothetical protein
MRLTIVTANAYLALGATAKSEFFRVMIKEGAKDMDTAQIVTQDFLTRFGQMGTMEIPNSFTESYKAQCLKILSENEGKFCVITEDWIIDPESKEAKFYFELANQLNKGLGFDDAKAFAKKFVEHIP